MSPANRKPHPLRVSPATLPAKPASRFGRTSGLVLISRQRSHSSAESCSHTPSPDGRSSRLVPTYQGDFLASDTSFPSELDDLFQISHQRIVATSTLHRCTLLQSISDTAYLPAAVPASASSECQSFVLASIDELAHRFLFRASASSPNYESLWL